MLLDLLIVNTGLICLMKAQILYCNYIIHYYKINLIILFLAWVEFDGLSLQSCAFLWILLMKSLEPDETGVRDSCQISWTNQGMTDSPADHESFLF